MSSERGARISRQDVTDLATASEQLAVAAQTIRNMHPAWGEAVVNLIIAVNAVVVRIQNKGAEAYARYLQKHGTQPSLGELGEQQRAREEEEDQAADQEEKEG